MIWQFGDFPIWWFGEKRIEDCLFNCLFGQKRFEDLMVCRFDDLMISWFDDSAIWRFGELDICRFDDLPIWWKAIWRLVSAGGVKGSFGVWPKLVRCFVYFVNRHFKVLISVLNFKVLYIWWKAIWRLIVQLSISSKAIWRLDDLLIRRFGDLGICRFVDL